MAEQDQQPGSSPDLRSVVRALIRANREMVNALEQIVGKPAPRAAFVATEFQRDILAQLKGKALTGNALILKLDCSKRRLYKHPGGIGELMEESLIINHPRLGYYRPDDPPPEILVQKP